MRASVERLSCARLGFLVVILSAAKDLASL
ncbi:MAG: hypothetical protein AVDCRST_MAG64-1110, partial [uncultured Phycisphaerae bacterium]